MSNRPKPPNSGRGSRRATDRAGAGSNPLLKWLIGGVVALVAVAVAFAATRDAEDSEESSSVPQVSDVTFVGDSLPVFEETLGDPAVGAAAPGFAATTFDGVEVSVQPGDGTSKVIGFFAHWCPHCQRELPRITKWLAENRLPPGVEVIAVSTAVNPDSPNYPPSAWFEAEQWPAKAVRDSVESEIGDAYGLGGFPYMVVVDGQGRVVTRVSGELSDTQWESLLATAAAAAG